MSDNFYTPPNPQSTELESQEALPKFNLISGLVDIFTAPSAFFERFNGQGKTFWFPYLILAVFGLLFFGIYANSIDMYDLMDASMQASGGSMDDLPPEALGMTLAFTKYALMSAPVFIGLVYLVFAVYLMICSNIVSAKKITFGTWFSFSLWTALPMAFSYIVMLLMFIKSGSGDTFIMISQLNALSLNGLIFHLDGTDPAAEILAKFDVFYFWSIGLCVLGFKKLTTSSWMSASLIILLPLIALNAVQLFFVMG